MERLPALSKAYDCLIVGAGIPGCTLALKLARYGLHVALVDKLRERKIGHSWEVTVEKDMFARAGILLPEERHCVEISEYDRYYALKREHFVEVCNLGKFPDNISISHQYLNQLLLQKLSSLKIDFYDNFQVDAPLIQEDRVCGVKGYYWSIFNKRQFKDLRASLLVDASGVASVLRKRLPETYPVKKKLRRQDFAYAWQQLRFPSESEKADLMQEFAIKPGMAYTRLGIASAFENIFLRKDGSLSLIFGASTLASEKSARQLCHDFSRQWPFLGSLVQEGGGIIPLRRALDSMVGDRFLCIGDAACQTIPTMGSGTGSAFYAADKAARCILGAINRDDCSLNSLWLYNRSYQAQRGSVLASYDIIRRFLQSLSLQDLERVFNAGLLKDENFVNTFNSHSIKYNIREIIQSIIRVFSHPGLLPLGARLLQALKDSGKALDFYKRYPVEYRKEEFENWQRESSRIFASYRTFAPGEDSYLEEKNAHS